MDCLLTDRKFGFNLKFCELDGEELLSKSSSPFESYVIVSKDSAYLAARNAVEAHLTRIKPLTIPVIRCSSGCILADICSVACQF